MSKSMFKERIPKLIVSRRAIAMGIGSLVATPVMGRELTKQLETLENVRLTFDPSEYSDMMKDGLFLPDYRCPMVRVLFEDGQASAWHRYPAYQPKHSKSLPWDKMYAIETCAPDKNGAPRYQQLKIG